MTINSLFAIAKGSLATGMLLLVYFSVVSVISGWSFALNQFRQYWYYVVALSIGFGVQIGLFSLVRSLHKEASAGMIATSATTSTAAMLSCCAHYLVNFIPILGVTGLVTLFAQYQIQFFWVGIAANLFGIAYLLSQLAQYRRYEIA